MARLASNQSERITEIRPFHTRFEVMRSQAKRLRNDPQTILMLFALYFGLLAATLGLSWHDGAFRGGFGGYPDEAAHYVTGLMFHDYILSQHYFSPVKFAENFYLHYPKVAIGHWPPLMYAVEGVWMILFSTSRGSLMVLAAAITALVSFLLYQTLKNELGRLLAFATALCFAALPLVQQVTSLVMADGLLTFFTFLAAISFGRYIETEASQDSLLFGLFASLSILTKGSAIALALLPPIAIALTGRWNLYRKRSFWSAACVVFLACGPWLWITRHMQRGTWQQSTPTVSYTVTAAKFYLIHFFSILGWPLASLALLGLVTSFIESKPTHRKGLWAALAGLMLAFFIELSVLPFGGEERHFLPAIPAALAFATAGISIAASKVREIRIKPVLLSAVFLVAFGLTAFGFRQEPTFGFGPVAELLTSAPLGHDDVLLVASDANGEGMMTSEVAMRDRRPGHIVLRASKVIAVSDWTGRNLTPLFHSSEELESYLDYVPVSAVILDYSASRADFRDYESVLEQTIIAHQNVWKLVGSYSVWRKGIHYRDAAQVYIRSNAPSSPPGTIRIDMTNMLGKDLTLHVGSSDPDVAK